MRRGQNKRKYAKLYFLHAQVGVTPKQAHPLLSMSFWVQCKISRPPSLGQIRYCYRTLCVTELGGLCSVLSALKETRPDQCRHCPALLGSISTGSKFQLRDKLLQGDLQEPRTFHLLLLLPVPSSQDSPECHLFYSLLSLSGD